MTKRKVLPIAAVLLALIFGSVVGMSKLSTNAQAAPAQTTQTTVQQAGSDVSDTAAEPNEGVEKEEPANEKAQDQNLPGGGHQDQGEADHQFEGVE